MIRKQIYLTDHINQELEKLAAARGVPQAELIREGLALYLDNVKQQESSWEQLKHKMLASNYAGIAWNREALYEDRTGRERGPADA